MEKDITKSEDVAEESSGRACIIYGRDQIMNRQVVSVIKGLGIAPDVMPVQGDQAKSTSVFLAGHPGVTFAIIILSADDWVYPKNGKPGEAKMYTDQRVAFHLGFWVGHLGRSRVFALYYDQGSFRWPTEHFDVIYTPLDKIGLWKKELEQRLKAASIHFIK